MAIYNVNKDTGDITETAGKYGSSNSVFYGTIAQWNALTTEQKKAYDHASIPDSLDGGEFNVNKTDGSLLQTAGMPSEYPATQVMLSDGVTSVEDALDGLTANTFGASYSISAYSSVNNMFTCPSDGYVRLRAEGSVGNMVSLYNANQEILSRAVVSVVNRDNWNTVYVKKGMQLYVNIITSNYSDVVYMPLS